MSESQLSAPPEWAWFLQSLDQKLETLREQNGRMLERLHALEVQQQETLDPLKADLKKQQLEIKELEQNLQYLSHNTQLQLKNAENENERFRHVTEARVNEVHFATREDLSALNRRLEVLEKLIF